jgi:hypothetical protein
MLIPLLSRLLTLLLNSRLCRSTSVPLSWLFVIFTCLPSLHVRLFPGDFNAHHASWFSYRNPSDPRGELLASELDSSDFCILNTNLPTRLSFYGSPGSFPDISIAPAHLLPSLTWSVHTRLNSDHLPITVSISSDRQTPEPKNLSQTSSLPTAQASSERLRMLFYFSLIPQTCARDECRFRDVLVKASKHHIPSGYRKDYFLTFGHFFPLLHYSHQSPLLDYKIGFIRVKFQMDSSTSLTFQPYGSTPALSPSLNQAKRQTKAQAISQSLFCFRASRCWSVSSSLT